MAKFTINIEGLVKVSAQLNAAPERLTKKADAIIRDNVGQMVRNAKRDAPVDMGKLRNSITVQKDGELAYSMVCQSSVAPFMEFGTKGRYQPIPGVDASEFKSNKCESGKGFYDSILEWVKRKQIGVTYNVKTRRKEGTAKKRQEQFEQIAWAIYLTIFKEGVRPQPFFHQQGPKQEPKINADFQKLVDNAFSI
jgi:hypothetical protein